MAFELDLLARASSAPVGASDLCRLLFMRRRFTSDVEDVYVFRDYNTEVCFQFEYISSGGDGCDQDGVDGTRCPRIRFRVDYERPSYFAREAMQCVVDVAESLDLHIHDPRLGRHPDFSRVVTCGELVESWEAGNAEMRRIEPTNSRPGSEVVDVPRGTLDAVWEYMRRRREIQEAVPHGMYAPRIALLAPLGAKPVGPLSAQSAIVWRTTSPLLLPEVDLVHVIDGGEERLVTRSDVLAALGPRVSLRDVEGVPVHMAEKGEYPEITLLSGLNPSEFRRVAFSNARDV